MSLFTPVIKVDDSENDFNWLLQLLRKYPLSEEFEEKMKELHDALERAEESKKYIADILDNTTLTVSAVIRSELEEILKQCITIETNVRNAASGVDKILEDAVAAAKHELLVDVKTSALHAKEYAERAELVVASAVETLKSENQISVQTAINGELLKAKNELAESVRIQVDSILSEIEIAKLNLQTLINTKTSELNTAVNNKVLEAKELISLENKNAVEEVKEFISTNPFYKRGEFILNTANWVEYEQTVSVANVARDSDIIVTHAPGSYSQYIANGVHLVSVDAGLLRFACESVPTENITVNVMILLRGADI